MQPTAEQFTEKAWAAILSAQNLAPKRRHQQLETDHLLLALLEQDGLASRILEKRVSARPPSKAVSKVISPSNPRCRRLRSRCIWGVA